MPMHHQSARALKNDDHPTELTRFGARTALSMPTLGKTIDVSQVKPRGRAPGPMSPRDVMAGVTAMAEFGRALDVFRQWAAQWVATREPEHERMGRVCCEIARERWHIARHALERDDHLIAADGIETDPAELAPW